MAITTYIGKGVVYLGSTADNDAKRDIGNASELVITVDEEVKEQPNYKTAGGGIYDSVSRIVGVSASINMMELNPDNLAVALRGSTSEVAGASITDEAATAYKGGFIKLAKSPDTSAAMTVTGSGGTPTYAAGTDYIVKNGGIFIPTSSSIADATALLIDYTSLTHDVVEALTTTQSEYTMIFDGLNEADSGKPVTVELHRVTLSPAGELGLISDDFAELKLTAKVLPDTSITTAGLSQYMKVLAGQ